MNINADAINNTGCLHALSYINPSDNECYTRLMVYQNILGRKTVQSETRRCLLGSPNTVVRW